MAKTQLLDNLAIDRAKATGKRYTLRDGGGLFLIVSADGDKWWRYRYKHHGRDRSMSLGVYPMVGLSEARKRWRVAADQLADGKDPLTERELEKGRLKHTFEYFYREWFANQLPDWSESNAETIKGRVENDVLPYLGKHHIHSITSSDVKTVLRRIQERGAVETGHRTLAYIRAVFEMAAVETNVPHDPTFGVKKLLIKKGKVKHMAALTDPTEFAGLLRAIDGYKGRNIIVESALKLAPLLAARPGELRKMRWGEINWLNQQWEYQASKTHQNHILPLSTQAVETLERLKPHTQHSEYVFAGPRNGRPLSENGLLVALRSLGFDREQVTVHGFRASFRTILDERLKFPVKIIEMQLAHAVRDAHGQAYNRTAFADERRHMMQVWADYCDALKAESDAEQISNVIAVNFRQQVAAD